MGWREYAREVQAHGDARDDSLDPAPIGRIVPNVPEAVAHSRLCEWHARLVKVDEFAPPPGWTLTSGLRPSMLCSGCTRTSLLRRCETAGQPSTCSGLMSLSQAKAVWRRMRQAGDRGARRRSTCAVLVRAWSRSGRLMIDAAVQAAGGADQPIAVDKFLVGAFRWAATLYDRWAPRVG